MAIRTYPRGSTDKLSANFCAREFDCKCGTCAQTQIDEKLAEHLQSIRNHFASALTITSGYRCQAHNTAVGGASRSKHMSGLAADIRVRGISPADVAAYAESIGVLGIGLYDSFTHIDTRSEKAFWYSDRQERRETFAETADLPSGLPTLKAGSKGATVRAAQILLLGLGYAEIGTADSIAGPKFTGGVAHFQRDSGLSADGILGPQTWKKLLGLRCSPHCL